jgi:hypothetical protein
MELPRKDRSGERSLEAHESDECDRPFAAARERFPGYNGEHTLDALDFILDGLETGGYTDEQWQTIAEHLGENVHSGLT